ncbi:hypothetical protein [Flavobacterium sp.]|uniref:hypothetical protein n=1 Tax=Flavobacterium sp. TaxID=239 RepID=UPI0037503FF6
MKEFRKSLHLNNKEIQEFSNLKNNTSVYYLESSYKTNKLFRYLMFLRKNKVNINAFIDAELKELEK